MSITITEVVDARGLRRFIDLPYRLYRRHPQFVPPLRFDEMATLRRDKNPAFDYCEARYWLAWKGDEIVGRVAGILNHKYIEKWQNRYLRFGWIDFIDDPGVASALLERVEEWARALGLEAVHGPLGFTDFDKEGLLVSGFGRRGTLATLYNYPYYPGLIEGAGYRKDVDWIEYRITIPTEVPEKIEKIAGIIERRLGLTVVRARRAKDLLPYASQLFALVDDTYADLYGVVPLSSRQVAYYTKQYFSLIRPQFVSLITDREGRLAAFGLTMPSLSAALQKARGRLFPTGFIHIIRALRSNTEVDMYLIAVRKELQGRGVNALIMRELNRVFADHGIVHAESNPELESNRSVQAMWQHYATEQHKRRRCYIKFL